MDRQALINTILMGSVFVLVISVWSICVVLWWVEYSRRRKKLQQRLGMTEADTHWNQALKLWRDEQQTHKSSDRIPLTLRLSSFFLQLQTDAGWKTSAGTVILAVLGLSAFALVMVLLAGYGLGMGLAVFLGVISGFVVMTQKRIAGREDLFERQFLDSLGISARALRAGHPLIGSFQMIADEIGEPTGPLFGNICQEQALGIDIHQSIQRIAEKNRNADLKLFATSVGIQLRSGGNLAELMDTLAQVMRARVRLNRRVRVLTAQTKISARILIFLPIGLFILLNLISPTYMEVFFTTSVGQSMLVGTIIIMVMGFVVMNRLSTIRY